MYTDMVAKSNSSINSIKEVLVDMTGQSSYMISAMMNYRVGNVTVGDAMAKQAVYIGDQIKEKAEKAERAASHSKSGGDRNE